MSPEICHCFFQERIWPRLSQDTSTSLSPAPQHKGRSCHFPARLGDAEPCKSHWAGNGARSPLHPTVRGCRKQSRVQPRGFCTGSSRGAVTTRWQCSPGDSSLPRHSHLITHVVIRLLFPRTRRFLPKQPQHGVVHKAGTQERDQCPHRRLVRPALGGSVLQHPLSWLTPSSQPRNPQAAGLRHGRDGSGADFATSDGFSHWMRTITDSRRQTTHCGGCFQSHCKDQRRIAPGERISPRFWSRTFRSFGKERSRG